MENTYEASDNTLFIPSKTLKIYPEAQGVDLKAQGKGTSQTIFSYPSYLNFINPETLRIRYNLEFQGRGLPKPNPVAGVSSLFRHMRTQAMSGMEICEEVDEYSSSVAMMYSYSQDSGKIADREINEGLSLTNNSAEQLFWNAQASPVAGVLVANTPKKVAISMPVYSGLLGEGASVLPVAAIGGCRLTLETNNLTKSIKLANDSGKGQSKQVLVKTQVAAADWTGNADKLVSIITKTPATAGSGFEVGDAVYYDVAGTDTLIGIVTSVRDSTGDLQLEVRGNVALAPATGFLLAVDTAIYTKASDRFNGWTPGAQMQGTGAVAQLVLALSLAPVKIDYTITDLESIVEQVQPPESYTNGLIQKLNSSEGLTMNYKNISLNRINLVGTQGSLTASVPNTATRVYALNAMPLNSTDTFDGDNLTCVGTDLALSYQFVINDALTPDQRVPLRRMSLTPSFVEQLHLQELRKSLIASGVFVRNLQNAEKNFVIGRAVAMYGAVSDITKSDLSLRIEYGAATRQKTLNVYVCSARTLVIRQNNVEVIV